MTYHLALLACVFCVVALSHANYLAPTVPEAHFLETFQDSDWSENWVHSNNKDYEGEWIVREADEPIGIEGDKGLVASNEAKKHGIAVKFDEPFDPSGGTLVVQYEVRPQQTLTCGGAYIKLLTHATMPATVAEFDNDTPYTIMFGPDKCGSDNRVHFIFRHQNPITKEFEEKHLIEKPPMKVDTLSHLYTLVVEADNTFKILIDREEVSSGNLLEDFEPAVNPPKEIDDPTDKKPADWVDDAKIPDPEATKPDDWDEDAPEYIEDVDAEKPEDWLDDAPLEIPDPAANKPEDWDEELDGDWEAPVVPNPACDKAGCGEWTRPQKRNPEYMGKWSAPLIDNPAYIGVWKPKQIPNPDYYESKHPSNFQPMGGIGIEIWTMTQDIMFDNIIVTDNFEAADSFAQDTWAVRHKEQEAKYAEMNKADSSAFNDQLQEMAQTAIEFTRENPAVIAATCLIGLVPIALCFMGGSKPKRSEKDAEEEDEAEEEPATDSPKEKKVDKKVTKRKNRPKREH